MSSIDNNIDWSNNNVEFEGFNTGDGIILDLVTSGYSDIKFIVGENEVQAVKSIICIRNEDLKSIINEKYHLGPIELDERVTENGFIELLRFYGGGIVVINSYNVIDILIVCLIYHVDILLEAAENYIYNHFTNDMLLSLMSYISFFKGLENSQLYTLVNTTLQYSNSYIINSNNLFSLSADSLKYILSIPNLLFESESRLLCRIFDYYNRNIKVNEKDENTMKSFKSILNLVSYKSIDLLEIPAEYQQLLFKYGKYFNLNKENEIKRIYMKILDVKNILLNTILLEWYINNDPYLLLSEERKSLLHNIEFTEDIGIILKGEEIKYKIMVLIMIIDLNITFDISKYSRVSLELINTYKSISSDSNDMKDAICKCLTLFTKDKQSNAIILKTKDKELISKINEYQSITSKTDFDTTVEDIKTTQISLKCISSSPANNNNKIAIPSPPKQSRLSITSTTSPSVRRHSAMYMMRSPRLFRDNNNDMVMPKGSNSGFTMKSPRLSNPLFDNTRFYACIITSPKYDRQSHYIRLYDNSKYSIFKLTYKITGEKKVEIKYKHKYTEFNNFIAIFFSVDSYICEWKGENIYTFYNESDEYFTCNNGGSVTQLNNIPQIKSDSTYHVVYKNKSISISVNDGEMIQLFSNIDVPVCPCISLDNYSSIELMSITEE